MRSPAGVLATLLLCLGVAGAGAAQAAGNKVYRWLDAQGRVHYGDQPPPSASEVQTRAGGLTGAGLVTPLAASAASASESDSEAAESCEELQQRANTWRNAQSIVETDVLGNEKTLSEEERQQLVAKADARIAEAGCDE